MLDRVHCVIHSKRTTPIPGHGTGLGCWLLLLTGVSVVIAEGKRPVSFRTRKLSPPAPMVLHSGGCGRVGRRRTQRMTGPPLNRGGPAVFPNGPFPKDALCETADGLADLDAAGRPIGFGAVGEHRQGQAAVVGPAAHRHVAVVGLRACRTSSCRPARRRRPRAGPSPRPGCRRPGRRRCPGRLSGVQIRVVPPKNRTFWSGTGVRVDRAHRLVQVDLGGQRRLQVVGASTSPSSVWSRRRHPTSGRRGQRGVLLRDDLPGRRTASTAAPASRPPAGAEHDQAGPRRRGVAPVLVVVRSVRPNGPSADLDRRARSSIGRGSDIAASASNRAARRCTEARNPSATPPAPPP